MPLTENQKQSRYNYAKNNLKRIPLDVQKEKYEEIKAAADAAGEKVNGYIKKAIDERMERDKLSPEYPQKKSPPPEPEEVHTRRETLDEKSERLRKEHPSSH